jgi:L-ascorbate metabolism protein UlaG (beta-lactamase superfamily)
VAALASIAAAASLPAAEKPPVPRPFELRATFIGNMAVQLTDGGTTLRTDFPYESGYSGYMTWTEGLVPPADEVLCLVTHSHRDHFLPALAARYCQSVLGPADVARALPGGALALAPRVVRGPLAITPVRTDHRGLEHYSYLVEWGGLRLYFTGDTEDATALLAQKSLDAAFVSPWLLDGVVKAGRRVDARRVVVYHHQADLRVPDVHDREVPRQGDTLVFRAGGSPR